MPGTRRIEIRFETELRHHGCSLDARRRQAVWGQAPVGVAVVDEKADGRAAGTDAGGVTPNAPSPDERDICVSDGIGPLMGRPGMVNAIGPPGAMLCPAAGAAGPGGPACAPCPSIGANEDAAAAGSCPCTALEPTATTGPGATHPFPGEGNICVCPGVGPLTGWPGMVDREMPGAESGPAAGVEGPEGPAGTPSASIDAGGAAAAGCCHCVGPCVAPMAAPCISPSGPAAGAFACVTPVNIAGTGPIWPGSCNCHGYLVEVGPGPCRVPADAMPVAPAGLGACTALADPAVGAGLWSGVVFASPAPSGKACKSAPDP